MKWVLILTLLNVGHGPMDVDQYTCRRVEGRIAAGMPVDVEREDGAIAMVIRARCIRIEPVT